MEQGCVGSCTSCNGRAKLGARRGDLLMVLAKRQPADKPLVQ